MIDRNLNCAGWFCILIMLASTSWGAESGAVPKSAAGVSSDSAMQAEVKAAYARFISGQNARDPAVISDVLVNSQDFVWAQGDGTSIWGFAEAMAEWKRVWKGSWHLDPQLQELRISSVAPGVAVLIAPLLLTYADPGEQPSTGPVSGAAFSSRLRRAGVFRRFLLRPIRTGVNIDQAAERPAQRRYVFFRLIPGHDEARLAGGLGSPVIELKAALAQ